MTAETLSKFYPDKKLGAGELRGTTNPRVVLSKLKQRRYLEKIPHKTGSAYRLTGLGRWIVLCNDLGISFLCLCVLAEAYVTHKHQLQNGCERSYVIADAIETFERMYCVEHIQNACCILNSKKYTEKTGVRTIRITGPVMGRLRGHDSTMHELYEWLIALPGQIDEILTEDPIVIQNIKNSIV